jgi:hypothetical protein
MLLLSPSVSSLQSLVSICELELQKLELGINTKKSYCLRIGPRYKIETSNIASLTGNIIVWAKNIRYLGVYIENSHKFKCNFDNAKRSFYRSFNAIFGKVGGVASEDVVLFLIKSKCIPVLLYGVEALPTNKTVVQSLLFSFNRTMFKLFKTRSIEIVSSSLDFFGIDIVNHIKCRKYKFLDSIISSSNALFAPFVNILKRELAQL